MKHYWTSRKNLSILPCKEISEAFEKIIAMVNNKLHSHIIPIKAIPACLSISKDLGFCLSINRDERIIQIIYWNKTSSQNGA